MLVRGFPRILRRRYDHLIKRAQLDRFFGHEQKLDRVSDEFLFLRQPKMGFRAACFSAFLNTCYINKKRDKVFGKIHAALMSFVVHEVESERVIHAEKTSVILTPSPAKVALPERCFIGLKTKHQPSESGLEIFAGQKLAAATRLARPVLTHDENTLARIPQSPHVLVPAGKSNEG